MYDASPLVLLQVFPWGGFDDLQSRALILALIPIAMIIGAWLILRILARKRMTALQEAMEDGADAPMSSEAWRESLMSASAPHTDDEETGSTQ